MRSGVRHERVIGFTLRVQAGEIHSRACRTRYGNRTGTSYTVGTGDTVSYRYVYGVVEASDSIEFETDAVAGGESVYPIRHRNFAALVSDVETTEPEETDEDARRHDEVLRECMFREGGRTIVPMQFGMVFENDRALKNVLRGGRPAFRRTIRDVEGTVELGLKIVREEDATVDRDSVVETVATELDDVVIDSVENGRFSDRLVLNRSYLVDRDERERFDEAVARLEDLDGSEFGDVEGDLTFSYSGPFAPYSFVDVHIGAQ